MKTHWTCRISAIHTYNNKRYPYLHGTSLKAEQFKPGDMVKVTVERLPAKRRSERKKESK